MSEEQDEPIEEVLGIGSRSHPRKKKELGDEISTNLLKEERLKKKFLKAVMEGDVQEADRIREVEILALINERVELKALYEQTEDRGYIEEPEIEDDEGEVTIQDTIQPIRRITQEEEEEEDFDDIAELAVILGDDEEE